MTPRLPNATTDFPAGRMCKRPYKENAHEVWRSHDGGWTWYVLKKWQRDDEKPYARWFCLVVTPIVPEGEMGDVYVGEIKGHAFKVR